MNETNHFVLTNQFLVAMPALTDPYFSRAVIYVCEHDEKGVIGIMINQPLRVNLSELLLQMGMTIDDEQLQNTSVLCGGPIHPERGFVLHTPNGKWNSSLDMSSKLTITTSKDILRAIATKEGPEQFVFALGYANWSHGQIEQEIRNNFWLTCPANSHILFNVPCDQRWHTTLYLSGIDADKLSCYSGHA